LADAEIGDVGFSEDEIGKLNGERIDEPSLELPAEKWLIVITCKDEQQQAEFLERFAAEGLTCKALIG
jgi:hypothetical protein